MLERLYYFAGMRNVNVLFAGPMVFDSWRISPRDHTLARLSLLAKPSDIANLDPEAEGFSITSPVIEKT
jgi:hypothetical protein